MTDPNEDFVSFEKALRELKMQSEELKKLVSEGEIRAFRDGQSMKFRREDVEQLAARGEIGQDEILFSDVLEDDTGMVTEELTEAETLLAEDDLLEEEPEADSPRRGSAAAARRTRVVEEVVETHEPGWVTIAAILSAVVLLYGVMIVFNIAAELPPSGLTSVFAGDGN